MLLYPRIPLAYNYPYTNNTHLPFHAKEALNHKDFELRTNRKHKILLFDPNRYKDVPFTDFFTLSNNIPHQELVLPYTPRNYQQTRQDIDHFLDAYGRLQSKHKMLQGVVQATTWGELEDAIQYLATTAKIDIITFPARLNVQDGAQRFGRYEIIKRLIESSADIGKQVHLQGAQSADELVSIAKMSRGNAKFNIRSVATKLPYDDAIKFRGYEAGFYLDRIEDSTPPLILPEKISKNITLLSEKLK